MKCFGLKPLTLLFLSPPRSFPILVVVQKGSHRAYIVLIPQGINCVCLGEGGVFLYQNGVPLEIHTLALDSIERIFLTHVGDGTSHCS